VLLNFLCSDRRTDMVKQTYNYCSFLLRECQEIKIDIKSMQQRPLQKSNSSSGKLPHPMGPKALIPCPQKPATCPYPVPDESSPYPLILFLYNPF
jgi:hypothetical protein